MLRGGLRDLIMHVGKLIFGLLVGFAAGVIVTTTAVRKAVKKANSYNGKI